MAKKEYLGVEPTFVGDGKPYVGLTGKIPAQAEPPKPLQNPPIPYLKCLTGLTAAGGSYYILENDPLKEWDIHHIFINVDDGFAVGTYNVTIEDTDTGGVDGTLILPYQDVGRRSPVDKDYTKPLTFKKRIRVYIGLGAGGDTYTILVWGFVRNK